MHWKSADNNNLLSGLNIPTPMECTFYLDNNLFNRAYFRHQVRCHTPKSPGVDRSFLLDVGEFDGVFVCLRSQSRPADFADEYGFNEPTGRDFQERYGRDIWSEDFDLQAWRDILGEYLTRFLAELRHRLGRDSLLAVGVPRGRVLGPPLGNTSLAWDRWVKEGIVDHLIIDQNSSQCPSMWHELWPMHRGCGYVQNYLDGLNMEPLEQDIAFTYGPLFRGEGAKLYVARQWRDRSEAEESALLRNPVVTGLVFSSFRHDNPGPVSRNDWRV